MDFLKRHKPKFAVALAVVAMIGVFHYIGDRVTAEDGGVVDHSVRRGDGFIGCEERGMRTKDNWLEIANANVANGLDPLTDVCHIVDGSVIDFTCDASPIRTHRSSTRTSECMSTTGFQFRACNGICRNLGVGQSASSGATSSIWQCVILATCM